MSSIGSDNGWLEAAIAWEVCASLHRQYCKGKDALFTTRQSDFVKHAENARGRASHGQAPAQAAEPVAPDFYTACAWHEGGGEAGWIPLPGHSNETENGVKHLVLEAARKEGYKGTAAGRLLELGWEIRPVFLTPQPTRAQAGAVPMDEARRLFDAGWKAAALFCDREDVVADGIIGFGACPQFEAAFSAAHGIKGGQHGTE